MIGITRLYAGRNTPSDGLRYGAQGVEGVRAEDIITTAPPRTAADRRPVVVWNVGRRCNLHCVHCYSDSSNRAYSGELTTEEAKVMIDDLANFEIPVLLLSGDRDPFAKVGLLQDAVRRLPSAELIVYPGIGRRMAEPERLNNIWYQSFHQMEMAPALVGASRESCRRYIGHFLRAWSHRKHVFDDQLEAFTDNFLKAGNLAGGFAHYRAAHAGRIRMMKGEAPALPPIGVPTCVRWAEHDPLFPFEWTDRLGETFTNLDLAMFGDVGHFPHREDPDRAASEIAAFFARIGWS